MTHRFIAAATAALLLAACGGGSGGSVPGGGVYGGGMNPVPVPTQSPSATPTPAGATPAQTVQILGSPGFVSPNGFTLYVFGADTAGVSNCNGTCAAVWPPFTASASAKAVGMFTVIRRADGSLQWAFNNHPLYNFTGDNGPAQSHGEGLVLNGGIWHVARP